MSTSELDETLDFRPNFGADGLISAIVQDAADGTVLMFAHMNEEALAATRETGHIHFYSRSRKRLWMKGETSGSSIWKIRRLGSANNPIARLRRKAWRCLKIACSVPKDQRKRCRISPFAVTGASVKASDWSS